jgi:hypothetical protein
MRLALVTPTIPGSEAVPPVNLLGTLDIVRYVVVRQICNISSIILALYHIIYTSRPLNLSSTNSHTHSHKRSLTHVPLNTILGTLTFALNIAVSSSASIFTPVSVIDLKKKKL